MIIVRTTLANKTPITSVAKSPREAIMSVAFVLISDTKLVGS